MDNRKKKNHIGKSIIRDGINPSDFNHLNPTYYCEQCSYFEVANQRCNLGYDHTKHSKETQNRHYNMGGKVAFCRFLEVD